MRALVLAVTCGCSFHPGNPAAAGDDASQDDARADSAIADARVDAHVDAPADAAQLGMDATVFESSQGDGYHPDRWQSLFLQSRSGTIWGGTAQVQRNIVGEKVLGLPKEPKNQ